MLLRLHERSVTAQSTTKRGTTHQLFRWLFGLLVVLGFFLFHSLTRANNPPATDGSQEYPVGASQGERFLDLLPQIAPIPSVGPDARHPGVAARAALLIDAGSGSILYADNATQSVPIASTTKLMTALLTRQRLDLEAVTEVQAEDTRVVGSKMDLRPGEKIRVKDLLAGLLLVSGNDAAQVLARSISGSVEEFSQLMNKTATDLGMLNTHYRDPAGLDDEGRSTAFDLAIIARAVIFDPVIGDYVRMPELTVTSTDGLVQHPLKNSNRLVGDYQYPGSLGLKTGFTPGAGHCLVAAVERDGHRLVSVILGTHEDTITASADESKKLLDWGWRSVTWPARAEE